MDLDNVHTYLTDERGSGRLSATLPGVVMFGMSWSQLGVALIGILACLGMLGSLVVGIVAATLSMWSLVAVCVGVNVGCGWVLGIVLQHLTPGVR